MSLFLSEIFKWMAFPFPQEFPPNFLIFSHPRKLSPLSRSRGPSLFLVARPRTTPPWNLQQPLYHPEGPRLEVCLLRTPLETKTYFYPPKKMDGTSPSSVEVHLLFPRGGFSPMAFSRSQSFSFQGGVVLERFVFLRTLLLSKVLLGIFHLIFSGSAQWQSPQSSKNLTAFNKLIGGDEWSIRMDNFPLMVGWDDSLRPKGLWLLVSGQLFADWWFLLPPIWKTCAVVKLNQFPQESGWKERHIWNHHLDMVQLA